MKKIVAANISAMPVAMGDPTPTVTVTLEGGEVKGLFSFYPDEIDFAEWEFIGLTEDEARNLKHEKDVRYLKS